MKINYLRAQVYLNDDHKIVNIQANATGDRFSSFVILGNDDSQKINSLTLPWRDTPKEAEADLMLYAARRGWKLLDQQVVRPWYADSAIVMPRREYQLYHEGVELDIAKERMRKHRTERQLVEAQYSEIRARIARERKYY